MSEENRKYIKLVLENKDKYGLFIDNDYIQIYERENTENIICRIMTFEEDVLRAFLEEIGIEYTNA